MYVTMKRLQHIQAGEVFSASPFQPKFQNDNQNNEV
jgi:hypothetical protein